MDFAIQNKSTWPNLRQKLVQSGGCVVIDKSTCDKKHKYRPLSGLIFLKHSSRALFLTDIIQLDLLSIVTLNLHKNSIRMDLIFSDPLRNRFGTLK